MGALLRKELRVELRTLESAPGQGTRVLVYLPSPAASSASDGVGRLLNT